MTKTNDDRFASDGPTPDVPPSTNPQTHRDNFILPRYPYRGDFSPEHLAFNANLQEFAARVALICNLETGGKISSQEAYNQIKALWKDLKASKKNLLKNDP